MTPAIPQALLPFAQILFLVSIAPLFDGLVRKLRARFSGRRVVSLLQTYRDLRKLLAKEELRGDGTWLSDAMPALALGATLASTGLIPVVTTQAPLGAAGGIMAFAGLLALARFAAVLGALDGRGAHTGTSASRVMTLAAFAEPAILIALFALALAAGTAELGAMASYGVQAGGAVLWPARLLAAAALALAFLAESGETSSHRPSAESELRSTQEGLWLEQSGPGLALASLSHQVRRITLWSLLVNLVAPWGLETGLEPLGLGVSLALLVAKLSGVALCIALVEAGITRLPLARQPDLLGVALVLACMALVFVLMSFGSVA